MILTWSADEQVVFFNSCPFESEYGKEISSESIPVKRIDEAIVTQGELVCESTNLLVHRIPEIVGDTVRCALSFASPFVLLLHPKSNMLMTVISFRTSRCWRSTAILLHRVGKNHLHPSLCDLDQTEGIPRLQISIRRIYNASTCR